MKKNQNSCLYSATIQKNMDLWKEKSKNKSQNMTVQKDKLKNSWDWIWKLMRTSLSKLMENLKKDVDFILSQLIKTKSIRKKNILIILKINWILNSYAP